MCVLFGYVYMPVYVQIYIYTHFFILFHFLNIFYHYKKFCCVLLVISWNTVWTRAHPAPQPTKLSGMSVVTFPNKITG